jgi:hypothetical protein
MTNDYLLEVNDLHVYYGAIHALKGISFHTGQGADRSFDRSKWGWKIYNPLDDLGLATASGRSCHI